MKFQQLVIAAALSISTPCVTGASSWRSTPFGVPSPLAIRDAFGAVRIVPRGGADSTVADPPAAAADSATEDKFADETDIPEGEDRRSLDERVRAAMKKYGLDPDVAVDDEEEGNMPEGEGVECTDGVCEMPSTDNSATNTTAPESAATGSTATAAEPQTEEQIHEMADRISTELDVDKQIVLAALGATASGDGDDRKVDEALARELIVAEREAIGGVTEDCEEVKQLVSEGHDALLSRRALAFADMNVDDARAILLADEEDEEVERQREEEARAAYEEEQARLSLREEMKAKQEAEANMKEIKVDAGFDPTKPAGSAAATGLGGLGGAGGNAAASKPAGMPGPAKKEDVVFDITSDQIQEIIMESPVPVLLDVYADWCGPCKALAPALEEMAVKAGGMFRLVKLNSDNERSAAQALEVKALPSVFGIRDGKIVNSFQGMPRDEEMMRNFMMGLMVPGTEFKPPVTADQKKEFGVLSTKLTKVAGSASFPFSARERLQDRTVARLDELVESTNMADAEGSAKAVRSLMSNIVRDPYEAKFRRVNLRNKVIAARVASQPAALSILKSVGFVSDGSAGDALIIGKGKKAVNVAPLLVARDCIDKWIDKNRYEIAKAARVKKDEIERARLAAEGAFDEDEYDSEEEEQEDIDPDACSIKLRIEGKKKVHDFAMRADDTLASLLDKVPGGVPDEEEVQITCTAKRLIVKSSDEAAMSKTLREHKLIPAAMVIVKVGSTSSAGSLSSLAERAKARQDRRKGEHNMASVGIYSKDDNAKGELIDGGGGVWYEHDVTSDEEPENIDEGEEEGAEDKEEETEASEESVG